MPAIDSQSLFARVRVVVDTNVLLAALMRDGLTRMLLLDLRLEPVVPEAALSEVSKHAAELSSRIGISEHDFELAFEILVGTAKISVAQSSRYAAFSEEAALACPEGHKDDWPFLALALAENCILWSNDAALKRQKEVRVFSTKELLDFLK